MTLSLYLAVAGRSPQRHATFPTHQIMHSTIYSVLPSTTKYFSSLQITTKVHFSTQSTTPVLQSTTKYYSITSLYYKVLQRTTPVLLCTTQYYSSITLYYTVLLQYYSVLQSTTAVLLCTTKYYNVLLQYYSHDWRATKTQLLLDWAVTPLNCDFTELFCLLFDWAAILLNCCFTELLLSWILGICKSSSLGSFSLKLPLTTTINRQYNYHSLTTLICRDPDHCLHLCSKFAELEYFGWCVAHLLATVVGLAPTWRLGLAVPREPSAWGWYEEGQLRCGSQTGGRRVCWTVMTLQKYVSLARGAAVQSLSCCLPYLSTFLFPTPCVSKVLYFAPSTHFWNFFDGLYVKGALGFGSYCKYFSSCTDGVDSLDSVERCGDSRWLRGLLKCADFPC